MKPLYLALAVSLLSSTEARAFAPGGGTRTEDAELTVPGGMPFGAVGQVQDLQGSRAVVGAPAGYQAGNAYVFVDDPVLGWQMEAKLDAGGNALHPHQGFGGSVAMDEDLIAVGAPGDNTHGSYAGRVYVFALGPQGWTQHSVVVHSDVSSGDHFGFSVALGTSSENGARLLLVGAPFKTFSNGPIQEGAVYAFEYQGGQFVEKWTLRSVPIPTSSRFGRSVAFNGQHAAIGASRDAFVFRHLHDGSWTEEWRLHPGASESGYYGNLVRIEGTTAYVSDSSGVGPSGVASGTVHVWQRVAPFTWSETATIAPPDGEDGDFTATSFDVEGNLLVAQSRSGADGLDGSIYAWQRVGSSWSLLTEFGMETDRLGCVELDGGRLLLGGRDYHETFEDEGIATLLTVNGSATWPVEAEFSGTNLDPYEAYGRAAALDGQRAAVGAPYDDDSANAGGAVYMFQHDGSGWQIEAKLSAASSTTTYHNFGTSVALEGDRLAAGAIAATPSTTPAVYVFEHNGSEWSPPRSIPGPAASRFGHDVDLAGDRLLVGAPELGAGGAGFVYAWDGADWTMESQLTAPGASGSNLGVSVSLVDDVAVLGDPQFSAVAPAQGAVFVFDRSGSTWTFRQRVNPPEPMANGHFGHDVAFDGQRLVVGSYSESGAVHVFQEQAGALIHSATMGSSVPWIGSRVVLDGNRILASIAEESPVDSVITFREAGTGWVQEHELVSSEPTSRSLGTGLASDGHRVLVGAPLAGADAEGAALLFDLGEPSPFAVYCSGDGTAGTSCPCGNAGAPGEGCATSIATGARIAAAGSPSVSANDLTVSLESAPAGKPGLLFSGTMALAGTPFGDGLRCAGGATRRHGLRTTDGTGTATWGPGLTSTFAPGAGQSVYVQIWYRDPSGPCGAGFNLSPGLQVVLAP